MEEIKIAFRFIFQSNKGTLKEKEVPPNVNMAQWALSWCLQNPTISAVIPGMKNIEQVELNAKAADLDF